MAVISECQQGSEPFFVVGITATKSRSPGHSDCPPRAAGGMWGDVFFGGPESVESVVEERHSVFAKTERDPA